MPATLATRQQLGESPTFRNRVAGALYVTANAIGIETANEPSDKADKRVALIVELFRNPDVVASYFARAAAGWNPASPATDMADTFTDTAGTEDVKVAAIADATIQAYVSGAWNVLAGVRPWERT